LVLAAPLVSAAVRISADFSSARRAAEEEERSAPMPPPVGGEPTAAEPGVT
jgi:hypothetical protein